ncbi:unnamed protein product [Gadus morhua 'NCC']
MRGGRLEVFSGEGLAQKGYRSEGMEECWSGRRRGGGHMLSGRRQVCTGDGRMAYAPVGGPDVGRVTEGWGKGAGGAGLHAGSGAVQFNPGGHPPWEPSGSWRGIPGGHPDLWITPTSNASAAVVKPSLPSGSSMPPPAGREWEAGDASRPRTVAHCSHLHSTLLQAH